MLRRLWEILGFLVERASLHMGPAEYVAYTYWNLGAWSVWSAVLLALAWVPAVLAWRRLHPASFRRATTPTSRRALSFAEQDYGDGVITESGAAPDRGVRRLDPFAQEVAVRRGLRLSSHRAADQQVNTSLLRLRLHLRRRILQSESRVFLKLFRPHPCQLADLFWLLRSKVLRLRAIGTQVVQLPRIVLAGRHDLPVADAQGPVAFV